MTSDEHIIEINAIDLIYGDHQDGIHALKQLTMKIDPHEFVCLLGPSGCGKSTLLKIIAGYITPTQGNALLRGEPITGPDKNRGVMFQSSTLYPWLNVRNNVEFALTMQGVEKKQRHIISDRLLAEVGLSNYADCASFELSGGMKQRACFARVLAGNPEIILMDEPFGALDALTRLKMQNLVRKLWQEKNSTAFMITHDIDEALALATRILIMSDLPGTIEEIIPVAYTYQALNHKKGRVYPDREYLRIKEHILDLIE